MNNKGFLSIDFIFSIAFILIIAIIFLSLGLNNLEVSKNINENIESRLILDNIASSINQVISSGNGYTKEISTPDNIKNKSYKITIKSKNITLDVNNKKGLSTIIPINLVDNNDIRINEKVLYNNRSYLIINKDNNINIREI
ncbi:hypothetical protein [Methanobrevibacter sp. DSM 116169]|uniref:hypothetical protein n=1 Tax=Methanobrevibacter sp. DSM 116169 TaxID=3242727 RepID=UPI0038FD30D2